MASSTLSNAAGLAILGSVLGLGLAACSIRPLPETSPLNFPRASTYDIVQKVRCEAKAGLDRFKDTELAEKAGRTIRATSIGYDFQFTMQENNDLGGNLGLAGAAKGGGAPSGNVDVSGGITKDRKNVRTFRFIEDLSDVAKADCSGSSTAQNLAFPISGALHIDELAYTYVRLETLSNLRRLEAGDHGDVAEAEDDPRRRVGVFSEYLRFSTRVEAGAKPSVSLALTTGSVGVRAAGLNASAWRTDAHDVIIAFAQDPAFHTVEMQRARQERAVLTTQISVVGETKRAVRAPRFVTALAQANAQSRNQVLLEIARVRNLKDNVREEPKFLGQRLLTFLRPPDESQPGE
ncbi:MAG: hypothetical protein NW223_14880 [Hyphomicrobiaceae bacterium]|nr:hypothetical protein [Hyphomicrobiaceae bacterium]